MNACELCVFGSGEHREDCTYLAKWREILKPLARNGIAPFGWTPEQIGKPCAKAAPDGEIFRFGGDVRFIDLSPRRPRRLKR